MQSFSTAAILTLTVGLVAIALVIAFSFTTIFPSAPVSDADQAKALAEQYASAQGLDLRVKEMMEFSNQYYAIIQEESTGINAFELLVDKSTGRVFLEPGPSMMWNTKYGHMRWSGSPTVTMPVSSDQALRNAQQWLDSNFPSARAEEAETFYGYYTLDFSRDNQIIGMLSVNGYSGEIWYHTWHGQFIRMIEYD